MRGRSVSLVLTVFQVLGVLAVLVGAAVLLPLGAALVVDGLLVAVLATAVEHIVLKRPAGPPVRRSGPNVAGGV